MVDSINDNDPPLVLGKMTQISRKVCWGRNRPWKGAGTLRRPASPHPPQAPLQGRDTSLKSCLRSEGVRLGDPPGRQAWLWSPAQPGQLPPGAHPKSTGRLQAAAGRDGGGLPSPPTSRPHVGPAWEGLGSDGH